MYEQLYKLELIFGQVVFRFNNWIVQKDFKVLRNRFKVNQESLSISSSKIYRIIEVILKIFYMFMCRRGLKNENMKWKIW